ncbi:MAG: galactoside ABC transporter permease [Erysipelotrichaceae bacterium]|nr:galactoside ABC transporter permease [Erysipelotrichaceae bacterium]MDY6035355.1 galactoside ABC transporter permease [Bulleidia sp.]
MSQNNEKLQAGVLSVDQEENLLKPITDYVGEIQSKIDLLRKDGTDKTLELLSTIQNTKSDKSLTKAERENRILEAKKALQIAQAKEKENKPQVDELIKQAVSYLNEHFDKDYYNKVVASCAAEKELAAKRYSETAAEVKKVHAQNLSKLSGNDADAKQEIKDENYVFKNKLFDAKLTYQKDLQAIKDRKHEAFVQRYRLIDLLKMSKFSFTENMAQRYEHYKYTFNRKEWLLRNGLYLVIILVFIGLGIVTPLIKHTQLFTVNNILNILQQASPRMFLALGAAGLLMLAGTDLSIGRMIGMGMVASTIIMHKGINTGAVFGKVFDFTGLPIGVRAVFALLVCIVLCTIFTSLAGFFKAKYKMHPFISSMSNMLIIFGIVTYATKGVSFGAIENEIPAMIIPKIGNFPTIILWAAAAVVIVWFIWNKTTFGKNLYAVGGNPEAAAVSGIDVFKVTIMAFAMAGVLYGFGAWLECNRMVGSGSAAYGQGWDMDAIAACVVGGVSFSGGIGKISGVVVGVMIFTALTYSLTILGIDTNLQFVFEGIIILAAVTLDCLKYVQKK